MVSLTQMRRGSDASAATSSSVQSALSARGRVRALKGGDSPQLESGSYESGSYQTLWPVWCDSPRP